jgi:low affinity Fe/Cu permease
MDTIHLLPKAARNSKCITIRGLFRFCAQGVANAAGSPGAFLIAVAIIAAWGVLGPVFGYSDTWQLVINTATTIVTFLMVFLIQNTQNRDNKALHLKLDELLRGVKGARTSLMALEQLSDEELEELQKQFERISKRVHARETKAGESTVASAGQGS